MILAWYAISLATQAAIALEPFPVQFARSLSGRTVMVCIDGRVGRTFAGKMGFRDENRSWQSVCADVRSPVLEGQFFVVQARNSAKVGGNYAKAGNIVAKYFREAQTPDQCAGLQIAVWEAVEDGGDQPDLLGGRFQAQANPSVMAYAQQYYQATSTPASAALLATQGTGGQSQLSTGEQL